MWLGVNWRLRTVYAVKRAGPHTALWLSLWALAASVAAGAQEQSYTVRRGDTLFSIAQRYGIAPAVLAERNGLSRNLHIYAGQRLRIPGGGSAGAVAARGNATAEKCARQALPASVQRAIDKAPVRPGRWQYIVIHHSGVDTGTVKAMDQYHREVRHMENGLAYDFVIGNGSGMKDGEIVVGRRWTKQLDGGHLASEAQNKVALGVCLVGNFDKHRPTARQMDSLRALVEALLERCRLSPRAVKTHQQVNVVHTRCPGALFPAQSFVESLRIHGR